VWASDEGEVMDIIFSRCEDVEDEHYGDKDQVNQSRWTCLRDCIDGPGASRGNLATVGDTLEEQKYGFLSVSELAVCSNSCIGRIKSFCGALSSPLTIQYCYNYFDDARERIMSSS
jgi:hypothetical protein